MTKKKATTVRPGKFSYLQFQDVLTITQPSHLPLQVVKLGCFSASRCFKPGPAKCTQNMEFPSASYVWGLRIAGAKVGPSQVSPSTGVKRREIIRSARRSAKKHGAEFFGASRCHTTSWTLWLQRTPLPEIAFLKGPKKIPLEWTTVITPPSRKQADLDGAKWAEGPEFVWFLLDLF